MTAVAFVLKGYPRLSETFIAQEILGLERRGLDIRIVSLRRPTDRKTHPIHAEIRAPVLYLPEYLWREPLRVWRAWRWARRQPGWAATCALWRDDFRRDRTANRGRRFGQALVLAHELPAGVTRLHAHFLHTPASVARYAARLLGLPWTVSAHAKDIWTTPDWEKREKLADCRWLVTCTAVGATHLRALAPAAAAPHAPERVMLAYHGIDLARFEPSKTARPGRDGSAPDDPVVLLSVGRLVAKKGYDDLLAALAALPRELHWRFVHIGGGELGATLRARAATLGLAERIEWRGARAQDEVLTAYRAADLFALASRVADDGDRDGLPNVLMEASSQELAIVSTRVSAIPELIAHGTTGLLVPPSDPAALADALARLIAAPALRHQLGRQARARLADGFGFEAGLDRIHARLTETLAA
jgi:glycosyltransferase involved in cell wall biosynthesis